MQLAQGMHIATLGEAGDGSSQGETNLIDPATGAIIDGHTAAQSGWTQAYLDANYQATLRAQQAARDAAAAASIASANAAARAATDAAAQAAAALAKANNAVAVHTITLGPATIDNNDAMASQAAANAKAAADLAVSNAQAQATAAINAANAAVDAARRAQASATTQAQMDAATAQLQSASDHAQLVAQSAANSGLATGAMMPGDVAGTASGGMLIPQTYGNPTTQAGLQSALGGISPLWLGVGALVLVLLLRR